MSGTVCKDMVLDLLLAGDEYRSINLIDASNMHRWAHRLVCKTAKEGGLALAITLCFTRKSTSRMEFLRFLFLSLRCYTARLGALPKVSHYVHLGVLHLPQTHFSHHNIDPFRLL
jgi:hypothetical protein